MMMEVLIGFSKALVGFLTSRYLGRSFYVVCEMT